MLGNEETLMFTVSENNSSAWEEKQALQQMVWKVPGVAAWDRPAQCPVSRSGLEGWEEVESCTDGSSGVPPWVVCAQGLSEPETLPQYLQPLPQVTSQHYSCHSIKQLVRGRSGLPHHVVHIPPLHDCYVPPHGETVLKLLVWCR